MSIEIKVILAVLATYRVTVLLCTDEGPFSVMSRARNLLIPYTVLLACAHCTGVWVAAAVAYLLHLTTHSDLALFILVAAGLAGGQSFMESCLEKKWKILGDE